MKKESKNKMKNELKMEMTNGRQKWTTKISTNFAKKVSLEM